MWFINADLSKWYSVYPFRTFVVRLSWFVFFFLLLFNSSLIYLYSTVSLYIYNHTLCFAPW